MHYDLSAYCTHKGETGTDESAKVLTQTKQKIPHITQLAYNLDEWPCFSV